MIVDRIFAFIMLLIIVGYGYIAFTVIEAPFQYDPLGPESWPRILAIFAALCTLYILIRPDAIKLQMTKAIWVRIVIVSILLFGYAMAYEPLGFIVSTILFCTLFARLLGAKILSALYFGIGSGILGYILCAEILDLNVPSGLLNFIIG